MEISEVIRVGFSLLLRALPVVLCGAVCFVGAYQLIYKKLLNGTGKINTIAIVLISVMIIYLFVVLEVTVLLRAGFEGNGRVEPLLSVYKDAWHTWSGRAWRNIVLNVLMFVPLGILLPLVGKVFRKFWVTYLCGAALSAMIEGLQLALNRGLCSLDDLINNASGAMIGYGLYSAVAYLIDRKNNRAKALRRNAVLSQIPLVFAVFVALGILASYNAKELGNTQYRLVNNDETSVLRIRKNYEFAGDARTLPIYKTESVSVKNARRQCFELLKGFKEDTEKVKFTNHDGSIWAVTDNGSVIIIYNTIGKTWLYTNYRTSRKANSGELSMYSNASEDDVLLRLQACGVQIPSGYTFKEAFEGVYQFSWNKVLNGDVLTDGTVTVKICGNGKIYSVRNEARIGSFYKDIEVISERDSLEMIRKGQFYNHIEPNSYIELYSCEITYQLDSKGYNQPFYSYGAKINSKPVTLLIPAIKE